VTEHELAYRMYLEAFSRPPQTDGGGRIDAALAWMRNTGARLGKQGKKINQQARQSVDWISAVVTNPDFTYPVEKWSGSVFNTLSDAYSGAMDGDGFLAKGAAYISPYLHRLLEGHDPVAAWEACRAALPDDTFSQEVLGYFGAMASDCSSVIGLPLISLSRNHIDQLMQFCADWGISRNWMIDLLHENATELFGAIAPSIILLLNFKGAERARFEQLAGSLGFGSVIAANPLGGLIALIMLGLAFKKAQQRGEAVSLRTVGSGTVKSGLIFGATSILGPVPVAIAVSVIVLGFALYKLGKLKELGPFLESVRRLATRLQAKMITCLSKDQCLRSLEFWKLWWPTAAPREQTATAQG
jgi:hypothetical protein